MKKIIGHLTFSLLILAGSRAQAAYKVLGIPGASVDPKLGAHVLVAGAGSELSDGFLKSAASRAYYLKAQHPDRAVVVIVPIEALTNLDKDVQARLAAKGVKEGDREARWIPQTGLEILEEAVEPLDANVIIQLAWRYRQIQSFEIFSHSSWPSGAALQGGAFATRFPFLKPMTNVYDGGPIDPSAIHPGLESLRQKMAPDSYAVMWGCNSAYTIAPMLSAALRVPVLGSLTFTDFERLHKDGNYYKEEGKIPLGMHGPNPWARADSVGYPKPLDCEKGCRRMKPNNVPYRGVWGNYDRVKAAIEQPPGLPPADYQPDPLAPPPVWPLPPTVTRPDFQGGGLGFYKAFCNFDETIPPARGPFGARAKSQTVSPPGPQCLRGLGAFMMSSIAPVAARDTSFAAYKRRLFDFLCPHDSGPAEFVACIKALENMEGKQNRKYSSHHGNALKCDFRSCHARFDYLPGDTYTIDQKSVRLEAPANPNATAQGDEYFLYLDAYAAYTRQNIKRVRLAPELEEEFRASMNQEAEGRAVASQPKRESPYPGPVDDLRDPAPGTPLKAIKPSKNSKR